MSGCPHKHPTCHRETEKVCPTKDDSGNQICPLGLKLAVYDLKPRVDGKVDITLSLVQREHLKMLAARGGGSQYDYTKLGPDKEEWMEKYGEGLIEHLKRLVSMGLVREFQLIGRTAVRQKLSEAGWKIVEMMKAGGV